jgi:AmmeMemoRadiSam system protein B
MPPGEGKEFSRKGAPVPSRQGARSARRGTKAVCCLLTLLATGVLAAQIPMERVLKRVDVPSEGRLRGLVDIVGFPRTAGEMAAIGDAVERLEREEIRENQRRFGLNDGTALTAAWCPHDDYVIAARVYAHVQRYIKAKRVILVGNAHWSETFGVRSRLVFDDFEAWRGPYGPVRVSALREEILKAMPAASVTVNRTMAETEHSLEALVPYLQYYDRDAEIVPIMVPVMPWADVEARAAELTKAVASIARAHGWTLGRDLAVLVSGDGQHYGDYGWSYYSYHPFGCDADGYKQAMAQDDRLVRSYLAGEVTPGRLQGLFEELVDRRDVGTYRITWCGRFAVPFGVRFAGRLTEALEGRALRGLPLRSGSSLAFPWLQVPGSQLGLTGDANLHHFVTYQAVGFR